MLYYTSSLSDAKSARIQAGALSLLRDGSGKRAAGSPLLLACPVTAAAAAAVSLSRRQGRKEAADIRPTLQRRGGSRSRGGYAPW